MTTGSPLRTLAVVRCGDQSLHESWAIGGKTFDVAVSYFGDDSERRFPEAAFVHRFKGGKWDGLYNFFLSFPETRLAYDYFWFPDDDLLASAPDVDTLMRLGNFYSLDFFQPSLDNQSYFSHLLTLQHRSFILRYSNFVEIMAPVLSQPLLEKALPTMTDTKSGFGLDFLWAEMAATLRRQGNRPNVAIVDAVCIRHTRPVGGSLHQLIKKVGGNSSTDELAIAINEVNTKTSSQISGVAVPRIRMFSGITNGGKATSGPAASALILRDLYSRSLNKMQPAPLGGIIRHALKASFSKSKV